MVNISITTSLLNKLAGTKEEKRPRQSPVSGLPGASLKRPGFPPAAGAAAAAAAAVAADRASGLARSRAYGDLLLKQEEQELAAIQQQAEALTRKHRLQQRQQPCTAEQAAVVDCYRSHQQQAGAACHGLVEAYAACADAALSTRLKAGVGAAQQV